MNFPEYMYFTLLELRQYKALSQHEIAKVLGVSQGFYNDVEKGRRKPNIDFLHGLAVLYGTSMDFIYHCYYRQNVIFNLPDNFLEYGMRKARKQDLKYIRGKTEVQEE